MTFWLAVLSVYSPVLRRQFSNLSAVRGSSAPLAISRVLLKPPSYRASITDLFNSGYRSRNWRCRLSTLMRSLDLVVSCGGGGVRQFWLGSAVVVARTLSAYTSNFTTFLFLQFLSKPFLKSAFRSSKWGFLTLLWNLVLDYRILKWSFPQNFRAIMTLIIL